MYVHFGMLEMRLQQHTADLEREIAHDRLVAEATRSTRPLRARLADGLYALAKRVEGQPRLADERFCDELIAPA
jgi:hypothetical protein